MKRQMKICLHRRWSDWLNQAVRCPQRCGLSVVRSRSRIFTLLKKQEDAYHRYDMWPFRIFEADFEDTKTPYIMFKEIAFWTLSTGRSSPFVLHSHIPNFLNNFTDLPSNGESDLSLLLSLLVIRHTSPISYNITSLQGSRVYLPVTFCCAT